MMENRMLFDINVSDITVISGIRPYGRGSERVAVGRSSYGLLYIFSGEATFWCNDGGSVVASAGQLVFIPKGKHYTVRALFLLTLIRMGQKSLQLFSLTV